MRILAVSGSLRAASSNTALLQAAVALAPQGVELTIYDKLGDLPHFNPDLDDDGVSQAVKDWRSSLQASAGVVFSTPEYAPSVPGVLKNALDWVVGSGELADKPVTLFNASPRGIYAQASLTETLTVMSARCRTRYREHGVFSGSASHAGRCGPRGSFRSRTPANETAG